MRVITDPYAVNGGVRVEFGEIDGFLWATRPNQAWPGSSLRYGPDGMSVTIDANGDLIDAENIPDDCSSNELSAFIADVLKDTHAKVGALLAIEERKQASVR